MSSSAVLLSVKVVALLVLLLVIPAMFGPAVLPAICVAFRTAVAVLSSAIDSISIKEALGDQMRGVAALWLAATSRVSVALQPLTQPVEVAPVEVLALAALCAASTVALPALLANLQKQPVQVQFTSPTGSPQPVFPSGSHSSPRGVGPEPHKQPLSFGGNINKNKIVRTSKPWHSDSDQKARDSVVDYIVVRLKAQRPNATEDWVEKLPQMAKRLEYALYHSANSTEEYMDRTTLKSRLQQLALTFPSKG